jgi:hypothetical protein
MDVTGICPECGSYIVITNDWFKCKICDYSGDYK